MNSLLAIPILSGKCNIDGNNIVIPFTMNCDQYQNSDEADKKVVLESLILSTYVELFTIEFERKAHSTSELLQFVAGLHCCKIVMFHILNAKDYDRLVSKSLPVRGMMDEYTSKYSDNVRELLSTHTLNLIEQFAITTIHV